MWRLSAVRAKPSAVLTTTMLSAAAASADRAAVALAGVSVAAAVRHGATTRNEKKRKRVVPTAPAKRRSTAASKTKVKSPRRSVRSSDLPDQSPSALHNSVVQEKGNTAPLGQPRVPYNGFGPRPAPNADPAAPSCNCPVGPSGKARHEGSCALVRHWRRNEAAAAEVVLAAGLAGDATWNGVGDAPSPQNAGATCTCCDQANKKRRSPHEPACKYARWVQACRGRVEALLADRDPIAELPKAGHLEQPRVPYNGFGPRPAPNADPAAPSCNCPVGPSGKARHEGSCALVRHWQRNEAAAAEVVRAAGLAGDATWNGVGEAPSPQIASATCTCCDYEAKHRRSPHEPACEYARWVQACRGRVEALLADRKPVTKAHRGRTAPPPPPRDIGAAKRAGTPGKHGMKVHAHSCDTGNAPKHSPPLVETSGGDEGASQAVAVETPAATAQPPSLGLGDLGFTATEDPGDLAPPAPVLSKTRRFTNPTQQHQHQQRQHRSHDNAIVVAANALLAARGRGGRLDVRVAYRMDAEKRRNLAVATATVQAGLGNGDGYRDVSVKTVAAWDAATAVRRATLRALRVGYTDLLEPRDFIGGLEPPPTLAEQLVDLLTAQATEEGVVPLIRISATTTTTAATGSAAAVELATVAVALPAGKTIATSSATDTNISGGDGCNVLGAYLTALKVACGGPAVGTDEKKAAAREEVQRRLETTLSVTAGSQPASALHRLLMQAFGVGFAVIDCGQCRGTNHFGAEVRWLGTLAPSVGAETGSARQRHVVLGVGTAPSKKLAHKAAIIDALRRTFPAEFERMRQWPQFEAPATSNPAADPPPPASAATSIADADDAPAPLPLFLSADGAPPVRATSSAARRSLRALMDSRGPHGDAAASSSPLPTSTTGLRPLDAGARAATTRTSSTAAADGNDVESPEELLRELLGVEHNMQLAISQHTVDDHRPVADDDNHTAGDARVLWLSEVAGVPHAPGSEEVVVLARALHPSKSASAVIACVKGLQYFFPEAFEAHQRRLPSVALEVEAPTEGGGASTVVSRPHASELALLRRAVNAAVADADVADDGVEERLIGPDDPSSPAPGQHVACLSAGSALPLVHVAAPSAQLALFSAFRALADSLLLDDAPPDVTALAEWLADPACAIGAKVLRWDAVPAPEEWEESARRAHLLASMPDVCGIDGLNVDTMLRRLAATRYGARLHLVATRAVPTATPNSDDRASAMPVCTATAHYAAQSAKDPTVLCTAEAPTQRTAMQRVQAKVARMLFPDLAGSIELARTESRVLQPSQRLADADATVDGALRQLLLSTAASSPPPAHTGTTTTNDDDDAIGEALAAQRRADQDAAIDVELEFCADRRSATVTIMDRQTGNQLATVTHDDQLPPLVALRHAYDTALLRCGDGDHETQEVWRKSREIRAMAAGITLNRQALNSGPVNYAAFIVARLHGLRLAFRTRKEQFLDQAVWEAEAVLCCASADFDVFRSMQVFEVRGREPEQDTPTGSTVMTSGNMFDAATVNALALGAMGRADSKRAAITKAAIRFLESEFPKEFAAARALSAAFDAPQSADREEQEMDRLRELRERAAEERNLAQETRLRHREHQLTRQRSEKVEKRHAMDAARHPGRRAVTPQQARGDAGDDGQSSSKPAKQRRPARDSHRATHNSKTELQTLLRGAHKQSTGNDLRLSTSRVSGGWVARAFTIPHKADGTLNLAAEQELGTEQGSTRDGAANMLSYVLLQKDHADVLVAAVSENPDIVNAIL